jgi:16S rRNA (guanine(966)-N(2))-methyltransferase RsmD
MIKITGGEWRGRNIVTPHNLKTRPTQARLRQALFNSIQTHVPDAKILDLFAGSGSLGFEGLSRGAASCVFVEDARPALKALEENLKTFRPEAPVLVIGDSVEKAESRLRKWVETHGPFDIVTADPPYAAGWEIKLIEHWPWDWLLAPDGLFCLEWGVLKSKVESLPDKTANLVKVREKIYGDSALSSYRRRTMGEAMGENDE